jgi:hypothetical protein
MELHALDGLTQIGPITGYTAVTITERDLAVGAWSLELPIDEAGAVAARMLDATWPGLEVYDPETGWRFGGFLTSVTLLQDAAGVESARFSGHDFQTDLAWRLDYPIATDEGLWWSGVYGGTIPLTSDAHNMVLSNAGPGAISRRQIAGMALAADPGAGPPKARRLKGDPVLDVLREMFTGTEWTARLRLTRSTTTGAASLLFDTPARPVAQIVLDAKSGTFGAVEHTRSASAATFVIAMGNEVDPILDPGGERRVVAAETPSLDWTTRYRELFVNRPSTDNDPALTDEAQTVLAEGLAPVAVKADRARVDGYGFLIDLGWLVDVRTGTSFGATTTRLPVVASTLTFTPSAGWVRTVDVGTETLEGPASLLAALTRVARRARKIEGEIR